MDQGCNRTVDWPIEGNLFAKKAFWAKNGNKNILQYRRRQNFEKIASFYYFYIKTKRIILRHKISNISVNHLQQHQNPFIVKLFEKCKTFPTRKFEYFAKISSAQLKMPRYLVLSPFYPSFGQFLKKSPSFSETAPPAS